VRRGVEDDESGYAGRFDELCGAANCIKIDKAGTAWNQNEVGGLSRRECLGTCGWRCVDNYQIELPLLCRFERFGESPLREEFDMGRFTFPSISPYDGAFLLVEIEQGGLQSGCNGQIDSDGSFANTAFLRNKGYFLHNRNPSVMQ
jgi:hypothetical protein